MGSSRIRTLAPLCTRIASESRWRSPPDRPSSGFSASSPLNRNWPSSDRALLGVSLVARWHASSTVRPCPSASACWASSPSLTLCPRRSLPPSSSRRPASAVISVVLPVPFAPTRDTCSERSSHSSASSSSTRSPICSLPSSSSKTTRPERSGGLNANPRPLPSFGSVVSLSIFSSFFARDDACLERVPALKRSTKCCSLAISACCFSIARPSASSRCAFSARQPYQVPLKNFERPPSSSSTRRAHGLEEPAIVRDEHDGRVELLQVRLEPLQRLDVEVVGGLVEQQQVGIAGQRPRQRGTRQLAAGERLQRALHVRVAEPEPVQRRVHALAPVVAAGVLELGLRARVGVEHAHVALGHLGLERCAAPPRARSAPCTRSARSRAASGHGRAAGAGRAASRARPW